MGPNCQRKYDESITSQKNDNLRLKEIDFRYN